jgi:hypothetical protein
MFVLLAGVGSSSVAQSIADFDDAAARLQYAFLTADNRALEAVLASVESYETDARLAPIKEYQLAYGYWKLAEIHAERPGSERRAVASAAKNCAVHARAATKLDARMAEAYALEAACEGVPQGFLRLAGIGGGSCAANRSLRSALSLAPTNPRVLMIEALCSKSESTAESVKRWRKVVDAFAAAPPVRSGHIDWGHPESLTLLGESYLQQKNMVAARDALERALVLAPDYRTAQQLLSAVASSSNPQKLQ